MTHRFEYDETEEGVDKLIEWWNSIGAPEGFTLGVSMCATSHPWGVCMTPLQISTPYGAKFEVAVGQEIVYEDGVMWVAGRLKLYQSKAYMWRKYVKEKMTEQEIADLLGVDQATINRWLKKLELKK